MKWAPKTERNLRNRMELRMKRSWSVELGGGAIIMGNRMEMGKRLLVSDGGLKGTLFRLDDVYEFVYYVPFMAEAMVQLWLLCDVEAQSRFRSFLCKVLKYVRGGGIRSGGGNRQRGEEGLLLLSV